MFFTFIVYGCFGLAAAALQEVTLPAYDPPTQDAIRNKYFQSNSSDSGGLGDGKSITENLYRAIAGNVTTTTTTTATTKMTTTTEVYDKNVAGNASTTVSDIVWTGLLKNLLRNAYETTTYRYPTATWTPEGHEKLKEYHRKMPKVFLMKPSLLLKPVRSAERLPKSKTKRGKIKWKDSRQKANSAYRGFAKEEVDKFLEQSLLRYLVSSNLIDNIGNVSVETFSEILRNVTRQKSDKRQVWPYDENRELRIKFRDEVFMRRKPESPSRGKFLEKQLQRRLERMKDHLSGKRGDKSWRSRNSVEMSARKTEKQSLTLTTEVETTATTPVTPHVTPRITQPTTVENLAYNETYEPLTTTNRVYLNKTRSTKAYRSQVTISPSTEANRQGSDYEELKLSVAETVYYKKRPFPIRMFSHEEEEETGVIPGIPQVDYPMYSSPPPTGFKCPKGIGDQPRMMADTRTRCQVFYVCTGDGPAAAMLCPNGTMFNENVRVCDWWYNVDC